MAGVSAGTLEGQRAAIVAWEARMRALAAETRTKYSSGTFGAAVIGAEAEKWLRFAEAGQTLDVAAMTDTARATFKNSADILRGILIWTREHPQATYRADNSLVRTLVQAIDDAVTAFVGVGKPTLVNMADTNEAIERVKDAPSQLGRYTLEQLLAALGLPKWALPALTVTAIAGVGVWAYFSFLAPAGGLARALRPLRRSNPRRRRRRA